MSSRAVITERHSFMSIKPAYSDFEKLVNSSLNIPNATSIVKYRLTAAGRAEYNRIFTPVFYSSWNKIIPFGSQPNQNPPAVGNMYELDCCFIPSTSSSLFDIFKDVFERDPKNIFSVNDGFSKFEEIIIDSNESVHFEVTADINLLPKKLKQIETAIRLWDMCIPHYPKPKVAGVIVTGSKENLSSLSTSVIPRAWDTSLTVPAIFTIPLFVIFSPFRNIYSDLSDLKSGLSNMEKKMENMQKQIVHLSSQIVDLRAEVSGLGDTMIWGAMTQAELQEECVSSGIEVDTTLSKAKLIKILMCNSSRKVDLDQEALQPALASQQLAV